MKLKPKERVTIALDSISMQFDLQQQLLQQKVSQLLEVSMHQLGLVSLVNLKELIEARSSFSVYDYCHLGLAFQQVIT